MEKPKIAKWKKGKVEQLKKLISEYPLFGVVNMENLPTLQLQRMRDKLRGKIVVIMAKKRLIKLALEQLKESKKDISNVINYLEGMPALIFTKDDPFKLSKLLSKGKTMAAAKAGQKAPNDITIPAGPTPFAPGPVIGELGMLGIKTEVKDGKIAIKEDKVVVKEGDVISSNVAGILARLGIEPMEVGLDLLAVYDNGLIYTKDVLSVDEQEYVNMLKQIHNDALALTIGIGYANKENIGFLLAEANREVVALIQAKNLEELDTKKEEQSSDEKTVEKSSEEAKEEEKPEQSEEKKEVKEDAVEESKEEKVEEELKEIEEKVEEAEEESKEKPKEEEKPSEDKEESKDDDHKEKHYDKGGKELDDKEAKKMKEVEQLTKDILEGKKVGG